MTTLPPVGDPLKIVWGKIKLRKPIIGVSFYIRGKGDPQFGASNKLHYDNNGNSYLHVCFMPKLFGSFTATLYFHDKKVINGVMHTSKVARYKVTLSGTIGTQVYLQDIDNLRYNLSSDLTMTQDLDFNNDDSYDHTDVPSESSVGWEIKKRKWTTGEGFLPIGAEHAPYTGVFDGNGFTLNALKIDNIVN
jgi:hypothetical protein